MHLCVLCLVPSLRPPLTLAQHLCSQATMGNSFRKSLGQAPALSLSLWKEWLAWILQTAGPRIYFVIFLTGAFGLRCGEALCLKRQDINVEAPIPSICVTGENRGGRKSPGQVYIEKQHVMLLPKYLSKGITSQRLKKHKHGKRQDGHKWNGWNK